MYTYHSIVRTSQRAGLNRKSATRMIENARVRGLGSSYFGGDEKEYLQRKMPEGGRSVVYAGYCFIFNDSDLCITMFSVPVWFGKRKYDGKKRLRKPRKYILKYSDYIEDYAV